MNGIECLVDTNILILLQNDVSQIVEYIEGKNVFVSFITELEILSKPDLTVEQDMIAKSMLDDCIILSYSETIKLKAIYLRKKYSIKLPDAIIAASSICFDLPLITCDKGFKKIKELNLVLINL
jgi:predicted nucleic acid-binding protein